MAIFTTSVIGTTYSQQADICTDTHTDIRTNSYMYIVVHQNNYNKIVAEIYSIILN